MRSRSATLVVVAALLATAAGDAPPPEPDGSAEAPRAAPPRSFTIAVLPDTQHYVREAADGGRDEFAEQTAWLATQRDRLDLRLVVHEGDVVDDRCSQRQWSIASAAMSRLDGRVPWTVLAGNHDLLDYSRQCRRTLPRFAAVFSPQRLRVSADDAWGGARRSGGAVDSWHRIVWGERQFVVLSLRYAPDVPTVRWARDVIRSNRGSTVILVTHDFLDADGRLRGSRPRYQLQLPRGRGQHDGVDLWRALVAPNPNLRLVLNGHVVQCPGEGAGAEQPGAGCHATGVAARRTVRRADGSSVTMLLANYQARRDGGGGHLRLLRLDPAAGSITVRTWSPTRRSALTDPANRFTIRGLDLGAST